MGVLNLVSKGVTVPLMVSDFRMIVHALCLFYSNSGFYGNSLEFKTV